MEKLIITVILLVSIAASSAISQEEPAPEPWVLAVPHCQAYIEKSAKPAYVKQWIERLSSRIAERVEKYGNNADVYLQDLFLDWLGNNGVKLKQRDKVALLEASLFICQFYATGTPLPDAVKPFLTPEYLNEMISVLDSLSKE